MAPRSQWHTLSTASPAPTSAREGKEKETGLFVAVHGLDGANVGSLVPPFKLLRGPVGLKSSVLLDSSHPSEANPIPACQYCINTHQSLLSSQLPIFLLHTACHRSSVHQDSTLVRNHSWLAAPVVPIATIKPATPLTTSLSWWQPAALPKTMSHRTSSAPSIRIYNDTYGPLSQRHRPSQPLPAAIPMAIPNAREDPPPPLPPPRYISGLATGQDPGAWWSNNRRGTDVERPYPPSAKSDYSMMGGVAARHRYSGDDGDQFDAAESRRSSQMSSTPVEPDMQSSEGLDQSDEERNGLTRPSLARYEHLLQAGWRWNSLTLCRLQSETQLGQRALDSSAQAYDKQLLSRIGGPNTPNRTPTSSAPNGFSKLAGRLQPLSVPEHRYSSLDSPRSKWPSAPSSGISPGTGFRSPLFEHNLSESPYPSRHKSLATLDVYDESVLSGHSQRSSVDQGIFLDPELEENGVRDLNINDRSPSASDEAAYGIKGIKRRASSPPQDAVRDDRASGNSHDLYHRRSIQMLANRNSPATRYPPSHGSISSNSSAGHRNSYASSWNLSVASSVTSLGGGERLSPSALSPSGDADFGPVSPYAASRAPNRSPRSSLAKTSHQRKLSEDNGTMSSNVAKMQPFYVCECCPKKPKKFDTKEELE